MCSFSALWIGVEQEFHLCHSMHNALCLHKNLESHEEDFVTQNEAQANDDTTKPH